MAKKRKSSGKKHRFSPDHVMPAPTAPAVEGNAPAAPGASPAAPAFGYATAQVVKRDVGRVLVLAAGFVGLMIILWVLFTHTGLGASAYQAVKL